jgi:hypothetical protein
MPAISEGMLRFANVETRSRKVTPAVWAAAGPGCGKRGEPAELTAVVSNDSEWPRIRVRVPSRSGTAGCSAVVLLASRLAAACRENPDCLARA